MRFAPLDQLLPGIVNGTFPDRTGSVAPVFVAEARLVGQRVHQPGLAPRKIPDGLHRRRFESLSRLPCVLLKQRPDITLGEVAKAQRLRPDVERATAENLRAFSARLDSVVAHVAHAAEDDALRVSGRALPVPGPELPQHGNQRVADQRVDLVEDNHQRLVAGTRPSPEGQTQRPVRTCVRQSVPPDLREDAFAVAVALFVGQFG